MPRVTQSPAAKTHITRDTRESPASSAASPITSRDNRWIKLFRAALRDGHLSAEDLIGLEGPHLIEEALKSRLEIHACLVSPTGEKIYAAWPPEWQRALPIFRTTDKLFESIAATEHPQGIAALVKPRDWAFDDLVRGGIPLIVVLIGVQDPGNVGTAIRSAEAFHATGAIATRGTADPWAAKPLRASAGSALRLPLVHGIAPAIVLAQLRVASLKIFAAAAATASKSRPKTIGTRPPSAPFEALREPCAILIGSEGAGLPPEIERSADAILEIPIASEVDSLNAGVAASLLLYEAARQRATQPTRG
jgi:RNA methyltransferase, TrmH family